MKGVRVEIKHQLPLLEFVLEILDDFLKNGDNLLETCFGIVNSYCYVEKLKVTLEIIDDSQLTSRRRLRETKRDRVLFSACETSISYLNEVDILTIMLKLFEVLKVLLRRIKTNVDLAYELLERIWLKESGESGATLDAETVSGDSGNNGAEEDQIKSR